MEKMESRIFASISLKLIQVDCNSIKVKKSGDINQEVFKNLQIKLQSKIIEKRTSKNKDGRIRLLKVKNHPKILIAYDYELKM